MTDHAYGRPLYALRAWKVTDEGKLKSTAIDFTWDGPGPHVASHVGTYSLSPTAQVPHSVSTCQSCGFHGYSTLEAARASNYTHVGMALGVILIWGDVASAECERLPAYRFRAMNALIIALQDDSDWTMRAIPSLELYPEDRVRRVPISDLELFAACMFTDTGKSGVGA